VISCWFPWKTRPCRLSAGLGDGALCCARPSALAMAVRALVIDVGSKLGRSAHDVEPFVQALKDNWYDSAESVAEASADDLSSLGLPRRFAVELVAAAADWRGGGGDKGGGSEKGQGKSSSKGKGKDKSSKGKDDYDDRGKGKGKSKGKSKGESKGESKGFARQDDFNDDKGKGKGGKGKPKGGKSGELRHTIPIDLEGINTEFKFRPKLLGGKGTNLHHIQDQTSVKVDLKGFDEDGYMEFVLVSQDDESMDKAATMCEDLIGTVFQEFDDHQQGSGKGKSKGKSKKGDYHDDKGKGKGKSKAKGKYGPRDGEIEERIPIEADGVDPEFGLRAKLVGSEGRNVKHIERSSNTRISVEYDDGEGMAFTIRSNDQAAIDSAKDMCQDLLNTVLEEAGVVSRKRPQADRKPGGKGKRKGKDASDASDRLAKVQRT